MNDRIYIARPNCRSSAGAGFCFGEGWVVTICDHLGFRREHPVANCDRIMLVVAIRQLMAPSVVKKKRAIGFGLGEEKLVIVSCWS